MKKHTKDEINFHGFLTACRTMQGVQMKDLTRGLYSKSMMSRVESGERLPKKLERDRLVARLGVSGQEYEDYLSREEYAEWENRQDILKSIEAKDVEKAEKQLMEYEASQDLDKVELQFLEAMRFMVLKTKGASREELRKTIELAVSYTIENIENGFPEYLILADQEINLLIEYVLLHKHGKTEEECRQWRLDRYQDIITYIKKSYIDQLGMTKIYPKLVYYICMEYSNKRGTIGDVKECFKLCNEAIELLRDTRKLFYFVELLEVRQWLIDRILKESCVGSEEEQTELKELAAESCEWKEVLNQIAQDYQETFYTENFCYLYWETESYCINRVVRVRRKMLKLTQAAVAGDACDMKTVRRTEQNTFSPQMHAVRGMFQNLNLCPEYARGNVITYDAEAMALRNKVLQYNNQRRYAEWEESLHELEAKLSMEIVQNRQVIMRQRILLDSYTKKIEPKETIEKLIEVLELTISISKCRKLKEWYFTMEELNLIYNIAVRIGNKRKNIYMEILRAYCDMDIKEGCLMNHVDGREVFLTGIADSLGDNGCYDESNTYGKMLVKQGIRLRRMHCLAQNLYFQCWNTYHMEGTAALSEKNPEVAMVLRQCILLSGIMKDEFLKEFFEKKLKQL